MWSYGLAILISLAMAALGLWSFRKLRILDKPGNDLKNTRKPVPTLQGLFVFLGFFVVVAVCFPALFHNPLFWGLFIGSLPIVIFEFLEELRYIGIVSFKVHQLWRLLGHILWGILAVYIWHLGHQELLINGFKWIVPQWIFILFFIWWSILCINAINRFDGIYAQASGVSSIGFLTIFLLIQFVVFTHYTTFTPENMQTLVAVKNISYVLFIISLISSLVEYKPLGLVRDLGIMFYGFALAYLSVVGGAKIGTLVVTLSLVIFDAIWVGLWRIFVVKKNPLKGDFTHLHHRLMGLGRKRKEVRATVWIWSFIMMVLILMQGTNRNNKIVIFIMMALVFFGINYYLFVVKKLPCGLPMKKEEE